MIGAPPDPARRRVILAVGAALYSATLRARPALTADPFTLGIASGYPRPSGVTLWTRLAPEPLAPDGGMPAHPVTVLWEVAEDLHFKRPVARGEAQAEPHRGHAVHVDVSGLGAGREYFYRFHAAGATSRLGRTRTAPAAEVEVPNLRLALACCQHYEHGYFAAYRDMARAAPDLVVHVGDYIYEGSWGQGKVRQHPGPDPHTLDEYRRRWACYRRDPDLQAMHAEAPWVHLFDDHEVENDYARDRSQYHDDRVRFLARRAAGWQAYREHLPLPAAMSPGPEGFPIHACLDWGRLARLLLLDVRQYRSYPPCREASDRFGRPCRAFDDPEATMLGPQQAQWSEARIRESRARWNLIAQPLSLARYDEIPGPAEKLHPQSWDAYPAARERLFAALAASAARNPVVLGGDWHAFWVNDLWRDFRRSERGVVAAEIVTSSISAQGPDEAFIRRLQGDSPWLHYGTARYRGYVLMDVGPGQTRIDLRAVREVQVADSAAFSLSRWAIEDGVAGVHRA